MPSATTVGCVLGLGLAIGAIGCGSSTSYGGGSAAPPPVSCSGATPVELTVKDFDSWCDVSIAGHAASSAASQSVCVAAGPVALAATALTGFELGPAPWHDTDGDHGSGDPGTVSGSGQAATSATTKTVSGTSACAWVCCPFTNGTGCPTTSPCP